MQMNSATSEQDFWQPRTLSEALDAIRQRSWRILAGGTDLYPGAGVRLTGPVLDLSRIPDLRGISLSDELRIGATTTWTEIADAQLPAAARALQQAARMVGGRHVQNAGTIGGNLCNASPAADGVPPLLALGAQVEILSPAGRRFMALEDFLLGPRSTALGAGELLSAVVVPCANLQGASAFLKLGARSHLVISIAMVAARLVVAGGHVAAAALSVGACSPSAVRLRLVEAALLGAPVAALAERISSADILAPLQPISDVRATAGYRRVAAVELVRRAVQEAVR